MNCVDAVMAVPAEDSGLRTALDRPLRHTEKRFRTGESTWRHNLCPLPFNQPRIQASSRFSGGAQNDERDLKGRVPSEPDDSGPIRAPDAFDRTAPLPHASKEGSQPLLAQERAGSA